MALRNPLEQARNLFSSNQSFTPANANFSSISGQQQFIPSQVLGASTSTPSDGGVGGSFPQRPAQPAQQAPQGGIQPGGPPLQGTGQLEQTQGDIFAGIDQQGQAALDALSQGESAARGQTEQIIGEAEAGAQRGTEQARGEEARRLEAFGQQRTTAEQGAESAISQARRQVSELQRGIQARFGGTTGTGAFASEILGRQGLQNIAGTQQSLQNTLGQIGQAESNTREETAKLVTQINEDLNFAKERARTQLQNTFADIAGRRGELESNKAELRLQALQNFQGLMADVNARNTAFKQQLFQRSQATAQKIQSAKDQAIQQFQATFSPFEGQEFQVSGEGTPEQVQQQVSGLQGAFPQGQTPLSPEDDLISRIQGR